jgi:cold-inducible RNA-binding protein
VAKKLYVGNLPYGITDSDLERVFGQHGRVESAQVITDRDTGRSKGFGFVEMGSDQEAQTAIQALNSEDFNGRALTVNEARPREERGGSRRESGGYRAQSGSDSGRRW